VLSDLIRKTGRVILHVGKKTNHGLEASVVSVLIRISSRNSLLKFRQLVHFVLLYNGSALIKNSRQITSLPITLRQNAQPPWAFIPMPGPGAWQMNFTLHMRSSAADHVTSKKKTA